MRVSDDGDGEDEAPTPVVGVINASVIISKGVDPLLPI